MDEGVVEGGENAGNTENELACILLAAGSHNAITRNAPSPAKGPRVTFSLAAAPAAGVFLGAIAIVGCGMEYGKKRRGRRTTDSNESWIEKWVCALDGVYHF